MSELSSSACTVSRAHPAARASDAELIDAFVNGDRAAFTELWERHAKPLRRFLRSKFGGGVALEDVLQEASLVLALNAANIRDPKTLRTYLVTIVRRMAAIQGRRARRREQSELAVSRDLAVSPFDHDAHETLKTLERLLDRLSQRRRTAFILCCVEEQTIEEAAGTLGVSLGTVRRDVQAARRSMLRWMASGGARPLRARERRPDGVSPPP